MNKTIAESISSVYRVFTRLREQGHPLWLASTEGYQPDFLRVAFLLARDKLMRACYRYRRTSGFACG